MKVPEVKMDRLIAWQRATAEQIRGLARSFGRIRLRAMGTRGHRL